MRNKSYCLMFMLLLFSSLVYAQTWESFTKENNSLPDNEVRSICIDNFNYKWFGTKNGLTRYNGNTWTTYTTKNGLAHNTVNGLAFEVSNYGSEIWAATDNGVSVISDKVDAVTFATPYRNDNTGLISNKVRTVAISLSEHEYQMKWFGTDSGVSCFDGNVWTSFTTELIYYLTSNDILSIFPINGIMVYFGTLGGGVSRFDSVTQATPLTTGSYDMASDIVNSIYATRKGDEWFGTDSGLSHHTSEWPEVGWTTYTTADGLAHNNVRAIVADKDSVLWIGTDNGLSRFDGTTWTKYTVDDGLAGNKVLSIALDDDGSLWFGTDAGVSHFIPGTTSVEENEIKPNPLCIESIYPNPFNMQTTISFNVPNEGLVELGIYNLAGQKVRNLSSSWRRSGSSQVVWDGRNNSGSFVSSGIYIIRLYMGGFTVSSKLTVLK